MLRAKKLRGGRVQMLVAAAAALAAPRLAHAANGTWLNSGVADGNWNTASNWVGGTIPGATVPITGTNANADIATFDSAVGTFGTSASPVVIDSASENVKFIQFTLAAGDYTIGTTGGNPLYVSTGGNIAILPGLTATNAIETVNAPIVLQGTTFTFANNSGNGTGAGAGTLNFGGQISGGNAVAQTLTLSGTNSNSNTVSGNIVDGTATSLAVTKGGSGNWTISGTNSYSGLTNINGASGSLIMSGSNSSAGNITVQTGTLVFNSATNGGIARGLLTLSSGGSIVVATAASLSNEVTLATGSGGFALSGSQSLVFNGNLTFVGQTNKGIVNNLTGGATLTANGTFFNLSEPVGTNNYINSGAATTIINALVRTNGVVAQQGSIQNSAGTLILTNNGNSYSGNTTVSGGTLSGTVAHAFGDSANVFITGGVLSLRGDTSTTFTKLTGGALYSIIASSGVTLNADAATAGNTTVKTMTIGNITTTSVAAAYTLSFTGGNNTSLTVGNITGSASTAAATDTITNNIAAGGNLTIANYKSANGTGGDTLTFGGSGNTVIGSIVGNGTVVSINKLSTSAGNVFFTAASTYTGTTTISAGSIILQGAGTLGSVNSTLTLSGGSLDLGGTSASVGNFSLSSPGSTLSNGNLTVTSTTFAASNGVGANAVISANLKGSLQFAKSGVGTLNLNGLNTYSGGTSVTAGNIAINNGGNATASSIGTGTLTLAGGNLDNTSGSDVTLATNNVQTWNSNFAYQGTNNQGLNLGTGTVSLGSTAGTRTVTVTNGNLTVGGVISNGTAGNLTKTGSGTLILNGANTFTGNLSISAGTLRFAVGALSSAANIILNPTTGVAATLKYGASDTTDFSAKLSNVGASTTGLPTVDISSNNVTFANTLASQASSQWVFTGNSGSILTISGSNNIFSNTGTGFIVDTNELDLAKPTGNATQILGDITVRNGGKLKIFQNSGNTNSNSVQTMTLNTGGTLDLNGFAFEFAKYTGDGTGVITNSAVGTVGTLSLHYTATSTYSGLIEDGVGVVQVDQSASRSNTFTITGNNTYTGGTTIQSDNTGTHEVTIAVGHNRALGTGNITFGSGAGTFATLKSDSATDRSLQNNVVLNGGQEVFGGGASGNLTFLALSSNGVAVNNINVANSITTFTTGTVGPALAKSGNGTLVFSGTLAVTGNTTVNAGALVINGAGGSGNITVAGNATLGGNGGTSGKVSAATDSIIRPGSNTDVGTISRLSTGNLSLAGKLVIDADLAQASATYGNGERLSDTLVVTGNVTLTGSTLELNLVGNPTGANNSVIVLIDNDGTDAVIGTFASIIPGSGGIFTYALYTTYNTADGSFASGNDVAIQFSSVPEPTSLSILGLGVGGLLARRRRRAAKA